MANPNAADAAKISDLISQIRDLCDKMREAKQLLDRLNETRTQLAADYTAQEIDAAISAGGTEIQGWTAVRANALITAALKMWSGLTADERTALIRGSRK